MRDRYVNNSVLMSSMSTSEYSEDLWQIYVEDMDFGALGEAEPVTEELLQSVTLSRRIAVREERSSGWRTRAVDDMTESGINPATQQGDKLQSGGVCTLVWMILMFSAHCVEAFMWKRDISKAFRRLPVLSSHVQFAWVMWFHLNQLIAAPHYGMPFGVVASVVVWHRVGAWLARLVVGVTKCPLARYVDDYFGASAKGIYWTGGRVLSILTGLLGFDCDESKSVNDSLRMVVLGILVERSMNQCKVWTRIAPEKVPRWLEFLVEAVYDMVMPPWAAAKSAGRLNFALCSGRSRAGRAYLKALFAQVYDPWIHDTVSPRLERALRWCIEYLLKSPASVYASVVERRQHVRIWTDASGVDRWVAAVVLWQGRWY